MKTYKACQSCAMPLKKDKSREEATGLHPFFCSLCFNNNDYALKNVTVVEFQMQTANIMHENGWPKWLASLSMKMLPKLLRWQQSDPDTIPIIPTE